MKLVSLTTVIASVLTGVLARSSVHMVSNNQNSLSSTPEISLNSFSMFYSHMMDIASNHPALRLQGSNEAAQGVQELSSLLPETNSLFDKKVDANMVAIVPGVKQDMFDTSFYVSDDEPENYVSLVETTADQVKQHDPEVAVAVYKDNKVIVNKGSESTEQENSYVDENYENFRLDFFESETDLFDVEKEADRKFVAEVEFIRDLTQNSAFKASTVRIIEVNSLQTLAEEYGAESKQYKEAQMIVKDLFEKFVIPSFQQSFARGVSTLIMTPNHNKPVAKRALPAEDTCFKSANACRNATSSCSGNGQCIKVQENCYTCACKSSSYIGESCQYIDAVGDFQLLFWTSVLLIVITASVVVCVYQSGNIVDGGIVMAQTLPKQD